MNIEISNNLANAKKAGKMNSITSFSNQSFKSKYQLDVNQKLADENARHYRDGMFGYYAGSAKNSDEIFKYILNRSNDKNDKSPWNVTLDLPDDLDKDFEQDMKLVGQNFNKVV